MPRIFSKRSLFSLMYSRFRILFILGCGCTVFILLYSAFGGARGPAAGPLATFPRKIWQSWKVDALRFESRDTQRAMTWTTKNPTYRYEVLTDDNAMTYVEQNFGPSGFNRPDIVTTYRDLKARIIQADLLRYLILYVEGGVWADIDVEAIKPVDAFIPKRYRESDISMLVGIETDEPALKDHPILGTKAQSFCQWTFMCKARLNVMMRLIDNILIWLNNLAAQQQKPISELELNFDEVLNGTGPSAFTTAILAEMSARTGRKVTWSDFHDLEESKVVGDILVLTSEAFAAGTGHSRSGNHKGKNALVKHHFHASSWTTNHPRYKHPIYGEVEKCNWDVECVKLWDANTAFFAALPKDDQRKMIAMKDREDSAALLKEGSLAGAEDVPIVPELGPPAGLPVEEPRINLPVAADNAHPLMGPPGLGMQGSGLPPSVPPPLGGPDMTPLGPPGLLSEAGPGLPPAAPLGAPAAEAGAGMAGLAPALDMQAGSGSASSQQQQQQSERVLVVPPPAHGADATDGGDGQGSLSDSSSHSDSAAKIEGVAGERDSGQRTGQGEHLEQLA